MRISDSGVPSGPRERLARLLPPVCYEMPFAAGFCHMGPERPGTAVRRVADSVNSALDLTCFRDGAYRIRSVPGTPVEKIAESGSNGNFLECFCCQMAMPASYPKPGLLAVYDVHSTPRGLPFPVIRCHFGSLKADEEPESDSDSIRWPAPERRVRPARWRTNRPLALPSTTPGLRCDRSQLRSPRVGVGTRENSSFANHLPYILRKTPV